MHVRDRWNREEALRVALYACQESKVLEFNTELISTLVNEITSFFSY